MRQTFLLILLFLNFFVFGQTKLYKAQVMVGGGYSIHGTGDMKGLAFFTEYSKPIGKRTEWSINVMTTIHGDAFKVIVNNPDGSTDDNSFRYSNAGLQAGLKFGYNFVQSAHHQFKIQPGGFVRYQNSTFSDIYSFFINQSNGFPEPGFMFYNSSKQNTVTVGYGIDLSYNFIMSDKIMIGLKAGFQNDTNGDAVTQICLSVGRRFN